MADTTTTTPITAVIKRDYAWFTQHILLLAFIAMLVGGAVYGVDSIIARHDVATSQKFEQILQQQAAQTATLQKQLSDDEAVNAQRDAQFQATIASLSQSIVQRDANAKKQSAVDASLSAAAAAQRLVQQTGASPSQVTVSGNLVTMDLPLTRNVVSDLDALVVARGDLADTQKQLTAQSGLTADANQNLVDAKKVIGSQTLQLADQTAACKSEIKTLKAKQRKNLFKAFFAGVVVGIIGGHAAGI